MSETFNKANEIQLPANILLIGSTKAGKSHYCKHTLLPALAGQFDKLIICSPTLNVNGDYDYLRSDDKTIFKVQENITEAVSELIDSQKKMFQQKQMGMLKKEQIPRLLLIIDDCLGERLLDGERSLLSKFAVKSRHYLISMIIMSQRVNAIPRQLRLNSGYFIAFTVSGYSELERIMMEYVSKKYHKVFQNKMIDIFTTPYNHLFIDNFERDITQRMYKNGSELIDWSVLE